MALTSVKMPGKYYYDEEHIAEWLEAARTEAGTQEYLQKYVFDAKDFHGYLERVGGSRKLSQLVRIGQLRETPVYSWNEKKKARESGIMAGQSLAVYAWSESQKNRIRTTPVPSETKLDILRSLDPAKISI